MNVRALLLAVCAVPLLGGADLADTTKLDSGGVLRQAGDPDSLFRVHLPSEIYERTIASSSDGITRTTEISFPGTVTLDGQAVVELYYDLIPGGSLYDHAVIAPISQYAYVGSNERIAAKAAKIVRCEDRTIIGDATLSVAPSKIRLQHPTFSEDQPPTLVILRYIPSCVRPGSVAEGINGIPRFVSIHSRSEMVQASCFRYPPCRRIRKSAKGTQAVTKPSVGRVGDSTSCFP